MSFLWTTCSQAKSIALPMKFLCQLRLTAEWHAGRQDKLGLAISLVSAMEEKVWYCTQKGYKPWFKPDASNTRTHEEGGHCIWYNEPALLKVCISMAEAVHQSFEGKPLHSQAVLCLPCSCTSDCGVMCTPSCLHSMLRGNSFFKKSLCSGCPIAWQTSTL